MASGVGRVDGQSGAQPADTPYVYRGNHQETALFQAVFDGYDQPPPIHFAEHHLTLMDLPKALRKTGELPYVERADWPWLAEEAEAAKAEGTSPDSFEDIEVEQWEKGALWNQADDIQSPINETDREFDKRINKDDKIDEKKVFWTSGRTAFAVAAVMMGIFLTVLILSMKQQDQPNPNDLKYRVTVQN